MEQTWPYKLLIRDDGSTDGTRSVLAQYAREDNVEIEYGAHIGLNASYMWLAEHCDPACDYYALSDQDDQWFASKGEIAERMLKQAGHIDGPLLFASRSVLTNSDMEPIGETGKQYRGVSFYNALLQNSCPGHTQILNRPLMELLKRYCHPDMVAFDWWVYLVASAFGKVVFALEPTVYHRQHCGNTVGYPNRKWNVLKRRVLRAFRGDGKRVTRQLRAFLSCAGADLPTAYRTELERFLLGCGSIWMRVRYACCGKAYRQSKLDCFLFRWLYLFGGY